MANISDAFGEIEFRVETTNVEDKKRLIKNMKKLFDEVMSSKEADYATDIANDFEVEMGEKATEWIGRGGFQGYGRWAFECNCRYTYNWLKNGVERHPELKPLFEELNNYDWSIIYDFVDAEGGCAVLYEMIVEVAHKAGADEATEEIKYEEDYEYNAENLVKLNFYDSLEDAKETCGE